jgi:hypothetical protein
MGRPAERLVAVGCRAVVQSFSQDRLAITDGDINETLVIDDEFKGNRPSIGRSLPLALATRAHRGG